MKCIQKWLTLVVAVALLATGCTGGSSDVAETATPTVIETDSPTAVPPTAAPNEPTPTPESVVLSDEERLAAAMVVFEADPQPEELSAYDILETSFAAGRARITICGWNGDTVFDQVRLIIYRVSETPGPDGQPNVAFESASIGQGECQNSTLVESALQATRDFDNFWRPVVEDPQSYDADVATGVMVDLLAEKNGERAADWSAAGLSFRSTAFDGSLPDSGVTDILGRRWVERENIEVLELVACRDLPEDHGMYQGEVLVDDFRSGEASGMHVTTNYLMVRTDAGWRVVGVEGLVWADCFAFSDGWLAGINRTFPEHGTWVPWES